MKNDNTPDTEKKAKSVVPVFFGFKKKTTPAAQPDQPPYEIIPFDGKDYRLLSVLLGAFRSECGLSYLTPTQWCVLRRELEKGHLKYYIAYADGKAVGLGGFHRGWDSGLNAVSGYLDTLFVCEQARGRGIGHALLSAGSDFCRQLGATCLTVVSDSRQGVFFESCGFGADTRSIYTMPV